VSGFSNLTRRGVEFDPHRPYQLSVSLHRTCENREAAKGSNNDANALVSKQFCVARMAHRRIARRDCVSLAKEGP
jgi:hypothetical protein